MLKKEIENEEQHRVWFCVILTLVCVCICVLQECVEEGDRKRGTTQGVVLCHSDISLCVYMCVAGGC